MSKSSASSAAYLKFLRLAQALRQMPSFPALDPLEERFLNDLAGAWHDGRQVTVLEAMQISADASARTLHRRLKSMQDKGVLSLTADTQDSRIKYITPTPATQRYFAAMGNCLRAASQKG